MLIKRYAVTACMAAMLLIAGGPSMAQVAPPALPISLHAIPQPVDLAYPGTLTISVDATDLTRRIFRVRETIPVTRAGPMTLLFPEWLPGNHGPVGPVSSLAGLVFTANGQRVEWVRDTLNPYAYHIEIPASATEVIAEFQRLSPLTPSQGRVEITPEMLNVQWEKMILYPAGHFSRNISFQPSITLPAGWSLGTALEASSIDAATTTFKPVDLEVLVDSPVFAGLHYRQIDLDPGGRSPVRMNLVADNADGLKATDDQIALLRALVVQADRLYGARHYNHYDFLVAATDTLGGIGLEHHRSSENSIDPAFFTEYVSKLGDRDLLPHEYTHSWNGKWKRPADQLVPNLNTPLQNSLLWVYEGQTQYWGKVLAARSGLHDRQQALDALALVAATYDNRVGREWRALQDTTNDPIISQRRPAPFNSWQRSEDYYEEGQLIWLDADTLIREKTGGRKSLDDFAQAFFGVRDGDWQATPYTFDLVVQTLNDVVPHDWATFLRTRLDGHGPGAPLDGLTRGGWRLVYSETPSDYQKTLYAEYERNDFTYSLGLSITGDGTIAGVQWNGPAFQQGLATGAQIVAVNGLATSPKILADGITAAKDTTTPIELIVRQGDRYRTVGIDYHGGLRYPRLERIAGTPDRLGDIFEARRR
ncbi:M61 family metallopeptidase [Brevundimonas variabilis]|uniref:Putative metalloprotease with PDZ domain n=1 Tax=Brevundimonas variabilis TaxID=74312 RepID=A0A7W9CII2_9CAUL|nr:M61 family metallopeptidase [Brevundimonas variabilis]MBB5746161.1 putative metalloprotease with PDZ domain [Brevundimonas variabilis]